jgi:hypothetical protein
MFNLHKNDTLVIVAGINRERILEKMEIYAGAPIEEKFNPNNSKSSKAAKSQALGEFADMELNIDSDSDS